MLDTMFIKVKTFSHFTQPLLYAVPASWEKLPTAGSIVSVPLRNKTVPAVVIETLETIEPVSFAIKEALKIQEFPVDPHYTTFLAQLADYHQLEPVEFLKRVKSFFKNKPEAEPTSTLDVEPEIHVTLTEEQQAAVDYVIPHIANPTFCPTVLHGVTGSGKTEVYKKLLLKAYSEHKTSVFLIPEVTLAVRFEALLRKQLPGHIPILGFHSATGTAERKLLWNNLLHDRPQIIIGVHLPILLPIANLGLIIVDEEHEVGFQEKKYPKIHSKEAAVLRAHVHKIPIVLGSATPSIATLHNVATKNWKIFHLCKRFAGAFPTVSVVNLLDKKQRKNFWISTQLQQAIATQLHKKEQTILFLNRRGVSFFVQCKECSLVVQCSSCSVSLTLHEDNSLRCHYCRHHEMHPAHCSSCNNVEFLKKGIGTQQVVSILQKMFPHARIARADLDTTVNRKTWQETMQGFEQRSIDILVGTQTITKGYDFPHVTLVGIIWADINLNFPVYNAQETTLQQLIQVAGRAGRHHQHSTVIMQTMSNHALFKFINEVDYPSFYNQEIQSRAEVGYPPCMRFAEIELKHTKESVVEDEAMRLAYALMDMKKATVLGPTPPPVAKIKKMFSRKIYLKSPTFAAIKELYSAINHKEYKSSLLFTPNPLT